MIGIIWIACGVILVISAIATKKNPAKALNSKARKRKANLSDEAYVARIYTTSITCGAAVFILGILWLGMYWK